jgi:hypothetical protein
MLGAAMTKLAMRAQRVAVATKVFIKEGPPASG